jgi:hypothetical protein
VSGISCDPIPESNCLVVGSRGERITVGCPGNARDACHVADERVDVLACFDIPYFGSAVGRGGGDPSPVGGYAHLADGGGVTSERNLFLVAGYDELARGGR